MLLNMARYKEYTKQLVLRLQPVKAKNMLLAILIAESVTDAMYDIVSFL